jgi:hypothetical protein
MRKRETGSSKQGNKHQNDPSGTHDYPPPYDTRFGNEAK